MLVIPVVAAILLVLTFIMNDSSDTPNIIDPEQPEVIDTYPPPEDPDYHAAQPDSEYIAQVLNLPVSVLVNTLILIDDIGDSDTFSYITELFTPNLTYEGQWRPGNLRWFLFATMMKSGYGRPYVRLYDGVVYLPLNEAEHILDFAFGGRYAAADIKNVDFSALGFQDFEFFSDEEFRFHVGETNIRVDLTFLSNDGDVFQFEFRASSNVFNFTAYGVVTVMIEPSAGNPHGFRIRSMEMSEIDIIYGNEPEETQIQEPEPAPEYEYDDSPQTPPAEAELRWIIPPALEHMSITNCSCGHFRNEDWWVVDPTTGLAVGYHGGHGGPGPAYVYDRERQLMGQPGENFGFGYGETIGMFPFNEFAAMGHLYGIRAVESVDSSRRTYYELPYGLGVDYYWHLDEDAFLGQFAVMYNQQFITEFIFDSGSQFFNTGWHLDTSLGVIAMRQNGMWGLIDRYGNTALPFIFENLVLINEERAFARYNGSYGILDITS